MSDLIITGQEEEKPQSEAPEINFEATEADEERFFLMYHMGFQPSEVENLQQDYRRWLIARWIHQKNSEREMMERQRLLHQLGPDLSGGPKLPR